MVHESWCCSAGSTPYEGARPAPRRAPGPHRVRDRCPCDGADQRRRCDFEPTTAVGQPVLISDHLNLTGRSPLIGPQFVDLVDAYSPRLRALARDIDPDAGRRRLRGSTRTALRDAGRDPDAAHPRRRPGRACRRCTRRSRRGPRALQVLGLSLVTNLAAGLTGKPISHAEVLEAGPSVGDADGFPARRGGRLDLSRKSSRTPAPPAAR